jgi:hypothetical protein
VWGATTPCWQHTVAFFSYLLSDWYTFTGCILERERNDCSLKKNSITVVAVTLSLTAFRRCRHDHKDTIVDVLNIFKGITVITSSWFARLLAVWMELLSSIGLSM